MFIDKSNGMAFLVSLDYPCKFSEKYVISSTFARFSFFYERVLCLKTCMTWIERMWNLHPKGCSQVKKQRFISHITIVSHESHYSQP